MTEFLLPVTFCALKKNISFFCFYFFKRKQKQFSLSLFQPQPPPPPPPPPRLAPPPPPLAHSSPKCPTPPQEKHDAAGSGAVGSRHSRCPAGGGRFFRCCRSPFDAAAAATFPPPSSSARTFDRHVAQSDLARSACGHAPGTHGQRPSQAREPQRRQAGKTRTRESQSRAKCPGLWQRWQITVGFSSGGVVFCCIY